LAHWGYIGKIVDGIDPVLRAMATTSPCVHPTLIRLDDAFSPPETVEQICKIG
jgi:hypothetical protein